MENNLAASSERTPREDNGHSSNITSNEIDLETANKLRGDAIGDTMYSEMFVLKTLLQFSDLKWSPEVEEDLCFLWDMTEEKDVCEYLFKVSYPSLACNAIVKYDEPRFIEIVIGIFGNLLCAKCEKHVKEDEILVVLGLLESNDPLILVQIMRFLHVVSYLFDKLPFITPDIINKISFILMNSINVELLSHSLKTLSVISSDFKISEHCIQADLVKATLIAYQSVKENSDNEVEFDSRNEQLNIKYLIQIFCNICSYIDNYNLSSLKVEFNSYILQFLEEIGKMLNYFTNPQMLLPVSEDLKYYMEALVYIFKILDVKYVFDIFKPLCEILIVLNTVQRQEFNNFLEMFCYLISGSDVNSILKDLNQNFDSINISELLNRIEEGNYNYDFDYLSNLECIKLKIK